MTQDTATLARFGALAEDRSGNVLVTMALALVPLTFTLGFGIDYARASMIQTQMNAAADAAALAATDALFIQQTSDVALAAAKQVFTAQVATLKGMTFNAATDLKVTLGDSGGLNLGRTVTVTYKAKSSNIFANVLGSPTLAIVGSATAFATQAPNINFFLVMDKSPSMLLPATTAGLAAIRGKTNCAFACHAQFPRSDGIYVRDALSRDVFLNANYYTTNATGYKTFYLIDNAKNLYTSANVKIGTAVSVSSSTLSYKDLANKNATITGYYADGYWLTHNYTTLYPTESAIPLRVGEETAAARALIPYAQSQAARNKVTYQIQFHSFDWTHSGTSSPVVKYGTMTDVNSLDSTAVPDLDGTQDWWYTNGNPTSTQNIADQATEFNKMLLSMNAAIPSPGDGTSPTSPQEVLMIITDGVVDESMSGSRRNRELSATHLANCTAIKNRGIKIAILYTQYLPEALIGDSWSQSNVAPYLPNVLPALKSCASTGSDGTPLVYTVSSDGSISNALSALFALTVQSARLLK
jgi:Flp pilus assembly protein TadG